MEPRPSIEISRDAPRAALLAEITAAARSGSPRVVIVTAPRGWGKGLLLEAAAAALDRGGLLVARVDLGRSVTNPDEIACSLATALLEGASEGPALAAIPGPSGRPSPLASFRALASAGPLRRLPRAREIAGSLGAELSRRRADGRRVLSLALDLAPALARDLDRPIVLVSKHLDEFGRLVHFPGLNDATEMLARFMAGSPSVRLIGTTSPAGRPRHLLEALAESMGDELMVRPVPCTGAEEIAAISACPLEEARRILAITAGRALTIEILAGRVRSGISLEEALLREFSPEQGGLFNELRFDYHQLLERTRGYAACRAILNILAREEGLDLSGIARRLRRSGGSTLDYLRWLVEVSLLRREGRRYLFADPLLRLHILIHEAPESPMDTSGRRALIRRYLSSLGAEPAPLRPRGRPPGTIADASSARRRNLRSTASRPAGPAARDEAPRARHDPLIEID